MKSLPKLPFAPDALSPHISAETVCFVHQKIMPSYVQSLPTPKKNVSFLGYLSKIEDESLGYRSATELYNHSFWLYHLNNKAISDNKPSDFLFARLISDFGSLDKFYAEFHKFAKHMDTRWVWLVAQKDKLSVIATTNESVLSLGYKPLAVCNLWEHAYYLDYRNRRDDYVKAYLTYLLNWQHAEKAYHDSDAWVW